ncbi:unnamed protein product [Larinioides sclopetarius]|uniref:Uncharacterized protein n=1 Tax=Larinioides sclopetarius TaxID=280406 RepID=A0AAV2AET7_9ARAC
MQQPVLELRIPILTLQKMSLIRATTTLCNNRQILSLILKCKFEELPADRLYTRKSKEWKAVQALACKLVSQICTCVKLREKIMEYLWPVCFRVMQWKSIYASSIGNQFLQHLYWTDQGKIDFRKTALPIIGNENIPIRKRFVLACSVGLDKEIHQMWREMSNDDVMYFYGENQEKIGPLILFWANTVEGYVDFTEEYMYSVCECAFKKGLVEAIKYLFVMTAGDERSNLVSFLTSNLLKKSFDDGFLDENDIDIGYFLYSEMSYEEKEDLSDFSIFWLSLLLHFSERETFLTVLEERLESVPCVVISPLLYMMFFNYHLEVVKEDDYHPIFVNIWRKLSASMKNDLAETFAGSYFLSILIRDHFSFLLRKGAFKKLAELSSLDLKLSSPATNEFNKDKWEFLHFLIEEEMVTIPALKSFREVLMFNMKIRYSNKAAWNRILRFVRKVGSKNRQPED